MTLVVVARIGGLPVFLSDVAITQPVKNSNIKLPSAPNPEQSYQLSTPRGPHEKIISNRPLRGAIITKELKNKEGGDFDKFSVTGIRSKVAIINDHFAIGWAGDLEDTKHAIARLKDKYEYKEITPSLLRTEIEQIAKYSVTNFTLLGWVKDKNRITPFYWNSIEREWKVNARYYIAGSGAESYLNKFRSEINEEFEDYKINAEKALSSLMRQVGMLLGSEVSNAETLQKGYGGAFECTYFLDNRFQKLGNVTYIQWNVTVRDNLRITPSLVPMMINFQYLDDILVTHTKHFNVVGFQPDDKSYEIRYEEIMELSLDVVFPIYRDSLHCCPVFDRLFVTDYFCNTFHIDIQGIHNLNKISAVSHSSSPDCLVDVEWISGYKNPKINIRRDAIYLIQKKLGELLGTSLEDEIIEFAQIAESRYIEIVEQIYRNGLAILPNSQKLLNELNCFLGSRSPHTKDS